MCANGFYSDGDYPGFFAPASAAGKSANVGWYCHDVDYHWPGAPAGVRGEYVTATANAGSGATGVTWIHTFTPSTGANRCAIIVDQSGAPTSTPAPCPPAPPAAAWGAIVP